MWPFRSRKTTFVELRSKWGTGLGQRPDTVWTARVRYDRAGDPYTYPDGMLLGDRCYLRPDGYSDVPLIWWEHASGPPVDFSGKFARKR